MQRGRKNQQKHLNSLLLNEYEQYSEPSFLCIRLELWGFLRIPTGSSGPDKNSPFSMMYLFNAYASKKLIPRRIRTMFRWPWSATLLGGNSFDITSVRSSSEEKIALLKNSHYLHYSFTFFRFVFWCKCSPNFNLLFRGRIGCLRICLSNCLTVGFRFSHCCYKRSYRVVLVFNPRHTCTARV